MAWAENNYIETRFVKGMNCSVEPHTLDRDTGELPDIMNMVCRTQGLRTRKGWLRVSDLSAQYGVLPTNAPSGLFDYEPTLPADVDDSGDGGDGDGDGGGSATNPIGGGGHGGTVVGDDVKPKSEEEEVAEEASEAWTLAASAETVLPYVPFDLTITWLSGPGGEPRWLKGSLLPDTYKGVYSGDWGTLRHTSANVWKRVGVMVRNMNRSITGVKYMAGPNSAVYAECQVAYDLYDFEPALPERVVLGEAFSFSVTCVYGNATVAGYKGSGRGVEISWKSLDENGNESPASVTESGLSWSNGVLTGTGVLHSIAGRRLKLVVTFLGQSWSAVANVGGAVIQVALPGYLHVYGAGYAMRIEVSCEGEFVPSAVAVECAGSDGSPLAFGSLLELSSPVNGSRAINLATGWSVTPGSVSGYNTAVWQATVRAKSGAVSEDDAVTFTFSYSYNSIRYAKSDVLNIEATVVGSISCSPSSIAWGGTTRISATLYGVHLAVTKERFPFSLMWIDHVPDVGVMMLDEDITQKANWVNNAKKLFRSNCRLEAGGSVRLMLMFGDQELASTTVAVRNDYNLAINAPETLHVFGNGGAVSIELTDADMAAGAPAVAIAAYDDSEQEVDFNDWFEDENGNAVDFTQGWTGSGANRMWQGTIRAKSSGSANAITLVASYKTATSSAAINVLDGFSGTLDAPSSIISGVAFDIAATLVSEESEEIPRINTNDISIRVVSGGATLSSDISTDWEYGEPSWGAVYSCTLSGAGGVVIGLYYEDVLLATREINVMEALNALVEAINERYAARGSSTRAAVTDSSNGLREKAIGCRNGFVKSITSSLSVFTTTDDDINTAEASREWYAHAYSRVCKALEYRINGTAYVKYYKSVASAGFSISYYDRNYDDSHSAAKEAAISGARSAFSFGSKSEAYSDARIGASSELLELSSSDPGWQAMLSATRLKFALEGSWTLMAPHCVLKMYAYSSAPSNGEYNKFGENVPAQDVFSVIKSLDKPQGTRNIESGWIPSDTLMPTFGGGAGIRGFVLKNLEVTAVFDFVYK